MAGQGSTHTGQRWLASTTLQLLCMATSHSTILQQETAPQKPFSYSVFTTLGVSQAEQNPVQLGFSASWYVHIHSNHISCVRDRYHRIPLVMVEGGFMQTCTVSVDSVRGQQANLFFAALSGGEPSLGGAPGDSQIPAVMPLLQSQGGGCGWDGREVFTTVCVHV